MDFPSLFSLPLAFLALAASFLFLAFAFAVSKPANGSDGSWIYSSAACKLFGGCVLRLSLTDCGGASGSESSESDADSDSDSGWASESELLVEVEGLLGSLEGTEADGLFFACLASNAALTCARAFSFASFSARSWSYCSLPAWIQIQ